MRLKRDLSKSSLLFLSITSIVGSGWLFGSFYTSRIAGPAAVLSWIIGGLMIAVICLTLAEIVVMFARCAGTITFANVSHGKTTGAIFSWITWLWTMGTVPLEVQAVIQYASTYISNLVHSGGHLTDLGLLVAVFLMFILSALNMIGIKFLSSTNRFIVYWKIIIPIMMVAVFLCASSHYSNLTSHGFAPFGIEGVFSGISTGGAAFSFFGFQAAAFLAGESKSPQRAVPFALFGSLFFCLVLYAALQLGFIVSLNPAALDNGGWAHISFEGDSGPFAAILIGMGFFLLAKLLFIDAMVAPFGAGLGYVTSASRILYSMGVHKEAPQFFSKLNRFSIPWVAIIVNFAFGMIIFLPFKGWHNIASFLAGIMILSILCNPVCLLIFRKSLQHMKRPFYLPFAIPICHIAFFFCSLILYWCGWEVVSKIEFLFVLGVLVACIIILFKKDSSFFQEIKNLNIFQSLWLFAYFICMGIISYFGSYGGGRGYLEGPYAYGTLFIMSIVIMYIAQKTALTSEESVEIMEKAVQNVRDSDIDWASKSE